MMRASVCASSVLPRAGRTDQQDVRLGQLDVVVLGAVGQALVVVVHGDREHALGVVLADHVVVEHLADVARRRNAVARLDQRRLVLLADDVHAELDAFVADEDGRPGDQLPHLVLALAAERAVERVLGDRYRWIWSSPLRRRRLGLRSRQAICAPGRSTTS